MQTGFASSRSEILLVQAKYRRKRAWHRWRKEKYIQC